MVTVHKPPDNMDLGYLSWKICYSISVRSVPLQLVPSLSERGPIAPPRYHVLGTVFCWGSLTSNQILEHV